MSTRKQIVERYFEGFRRSDHAQVLACLTDDVVWDVIGHTHLEGKEAFDGEIENENFAGSPTLVIDRLIEEDNTVVAIGKGEGTFKSGGVFRFAYCTVFTFTDDLVNRVESYVVPENAPAGA